MKKVKLIGVFLIIMAILGNWIWNNDEGKSREIKLLAEYQSIQQPPGAEVVFYKLERKFVSRWIFSCYKYPMSVEEVQSYYDQLLENNGWQKKKRHMLSGAIAASYKKGNLMFGLQFNKNGTWTVSMTYSDANY